MAPVPSHQGLGAGGLTDPEIAELKDIAQAISDTERRAMAAERETTDRLIAEYLAEQGIPYEEFTDFHELEATLARDTRPQSARADSGPAQ